MMLPVWLETISVAMQVLASIAPWMQGDVRELPLRTVPVNLAESRPIATDAVTEFEGPAVEMGYVILHGQFIPPPYVISRDGDQLLINEVPLCDIPPPKAAKGPATGGERRRRTGPHQLDLRRRVEQRLQEDGLVIAFDDGKLSVFDRDRTATILHVLLSEGPLDQRLTALRDVDPMHGAEPHWSRLLSPDFNVERLRERVAETEILLTLEDPSSTEFSSNSRWTNYALTVSGMVLAVFSFGLVLGHRPPTPGSLVTAAVGANAQKLVIQAIVLITVLSGFDLVCTYISHNGGGFLELNPLGAKLLKSLPALVAFKASFTFLSLFILFRLRFHRSAQMASWWLCLLCALLTARWVTVSSLLLT